MRNLWLKLIAYITNLMELQSMRSKLDRAVPKYAWSALCRIFGRANDV